MTPSAACLDLQVLPDLLDLLVRHVLDANKWIARIPDGTDQLVELGLHRRAVAILAVLDQEHGEKGQHRGRCIHDQLPGIGIMQCRSARRPDHDQQARSDKGQGRAQERRRT